MKRSELEKDAAYIFDEFKNKDYEIPSNSSVLKVIFKKLSIVYLLQLLFIAFDVLLNIKSDYYHWFDTVVLSLASNLFFSLAFLMSTYNVVCMRVALGDEIKSKSILLRLIEKKVNFYSCFLLMTNAVVGVVLLWAGECFVAGLGFSWFVTFLIGMITLQTSLSRYMTPAVVNALSKVREIISPNTSSVNQAD